MTLISNLSDTVTMSTWNCLRGLEEREDGVRAGGGRVELRRASGPVLLPPREQGVQLGHAAQRVPRQPLHLSP